MTVMSHSSADLKCSADSSSADLKCSSASFLFELFTYFHPDKGQTTRNLNHVVVYNAKNCALASVQVHLY